MDTTLFVVWVEHELLRRRVWINGPKTRGAELGPALQAAHEAPAHDLTGRVSALIQRLPTGFSITAH